jgi:glycosyltransferase involved in cell wall biosynthesis
MLVVIVVPCYNEARRLDTQAFKAFRDTKYRVSFLFVDDGSTDETWDVLESLSASDPGRFHALHLLPNVGKGEAVRQGLLQAFDLKPDYVGYWDADLATPLNAIVPLCDVLNTSNELEMVWGARVRLLGRRIERTLLRHYPGRVFATIASLVLGIPIYDTQCGAKVLRASPVVYSLLMEKFITRWLFDIEILARLIQSPAGHSLPIERRVHEFPLNEWHDMVGSKVKPQDFAKAFAGLFHIYLHYFVKRRHSNRYMSAPQRARAESAKKDVRPF